MQYTAEGSSTDPVHFKYRQHAIGKWVSNLLLPSWRW